jgi:hypothetical protein
MLMLMRMLTGMLMRMLTRMLMRILSTGADADAITDTNVDVAGVATAQCQCAYLTIALQSPTVPAVNAFCECKRVGAANTG